MSDLKKSLARIALAGGLATSAFGVGAAVEDDRLLASQCLGCHAADASGTGGFDRLNGETAAEISEELTEMRASSKELDIMHMQARGYTDDQIRRIADWFVRYAPAAGTRGAGTEDEPSRDGRKEAKAASTKKVSSRKASTKKAVAKRPTVRKSS